MTYNVNVKGKTHVFSILNGMFKEYNEKNKMVKFGTVEKYRNYIRRNNIIVF